MQDEVDRRRRVERQLDVPLRAGQRDQVVARERLDERGPELAAGARYEDASRAERIGVCVCHRCLTRGSSQGTPCSSGSAGSYSRVTW